MSNSCKKCGGERTPVKKGDGVRYRCRPCEAEYQRENYAQNAEQIRKRKAKYMADARRDLSKRGGILASQRKAWSNGGSQKRKAWMARLRNEDPWRWKALTIHTSVRGKYGANDLQSIWERQGGLCGLIGRPLDFETAELDHIIPRSRGGSNDIGNLRWACEEANRAKGSMTDEEFLRLCNQVAEWIGRRILESAQESLP